MRIPINEDDFEIDKDRPIVTFDTHFRFEITKKESEENWMADTVYKIIEKKPVLPILTELDEDDKEIDLPILTLHQEPIDAKNDLHDWTRNYSNQGEISGYWADGS